MTAGLYATIGVLSALYRRSATGLGAEVKTSLLEGQVGLVSSNIVEYWLTGTVPRPMGTRTRVGVPNEAFPTSDGEILIAAVDDRLWQKLCGALGREDLPQDPRFATLHGRRLNQDDLFASLAEHTRAFTSRDLLTLLAEAGVPSGPINSIDELVADEQFTALGMKSSFEGLDYVRLPFELDGSRGSITRRAPEADEHADEIRKELEAESRPRES
jgi:crotonobetainyl-CoA:carnitine CoA-transferase CaiB-like acyl-CoA transferase